MCGQVDASADAGTTTCHDEDAIKMFPSQQTACRKKYGLRDGYIQASVK